MIRRSTAIAFALTLAAAASAFAFGAEGCGAGKCSDCHHLTAEQAREVLAPLGIDAVENVQLSSVPGLWSVDVVSKGRKIPVYLDFSLHYLLQAEVIEIASQENVTRHRAASLNRVDPAKIPLEDALVLGDPKAKNKIVVFDDPECPFCKKLQSEMRAVVAKRPDIAFFIKMLPLEIHPDAYAKAKAILCGKSLELLEKSLDGQTIPAASCETDQIDKNKELAKALGIGSTPTLVFPDGRVYPGSRPADKIIAILEGEGSEKAAETKKPQGGK